LLLIFSSLIELWLVTQNCLFSLYPCLCYLYQIKHAACL
jgi:hypothetical protein